MLLRLEAKSFLFRCNERAEAPNHRLGRRLTIIVWYGVCQYLRPHDTVCQYLRPHDTGVCQYLRPHDTVGDPRVFYAQPNGATRASRHAGNPSRSIGMR